MMADLNEVKIESGSFGKDLRTAQPTHGLRWHVGKLQQAWLLVHSGEVNQEIDRKIEWRDVPNS
jgi:hypothetical protein